MISDYRLSHILQWPVLLYLIVSSSYIVSNEKLPQTRSRSALHTINLLLILAFVLFPIFALLVKQKLFIKVQVVLLLLTLGTSICIAVLEYKGDDSQRNNKLDKKLKVNARLAIANVVVLLLLYLIQRDFTNVLYVMRREHSRLYREGLDEIQKMEEKLKKDAKSRAEEALEEDANRKAEEEELEKEEKRKAEEEEEEEFGKRPYRRRRSL